MDQTTNAHSIGRGHSYHSDSQISKEYIVHIHLFKSSVVTGSRSLVARVTSEERCCKEIKGEVSSWNIVVFSHSTYKTVKLIQSWLHGNVQPDVVVYYYNLTLRRLRKEHFKFKWNPYHKHKNAHFILYELFLNRFKYKKFLVVRENNLVISLWR